MSKVRDRINVITDLLLGAVHADDQALDEEDRTVRRLLCDLLAVSELPKEVAARIDAFDAKKFDLARVAKDFAADPPVKKRKLLELVAAVRDADDEIDLAEDTYIVTLAQTLGMKPSEYEDLIVDYEVEDLRSSFEALRDVDIAIE